MGFQKKKNWILLKKQKATHLPSITPDCIYNTLKQRKCLAMPIKFLPKQ